MASRDASSNASSVRLNEFTSLDELALLSGPGAFASLHCMLNCPERFADLAEPPLVASAGFARNGRPPLRTLSSLDGVGVVRQSRVGLLRLPRCAVALFLVVVLSFETSER